MEQEATFEDEYEYEEVASAREKKRMMDVLNKKKLTRWEMDALFAE
ncbi:MAG: hypothetical protein V1743_04030 [Nanoarchaeota archaeon]